MAIGFEGAVGNEGLFATIRQQIADRMAAQQQQHAMSVEDQKLQIEKDRYQQEAQDRALLRQQQTTALNETLGEKSATSLGAGQTVLSPTDPTAQSIMNSSQRSNMRADTSLPSTQLARGVPLVSGQTGISPELSARFQNTTLAPLVKTETPEATQSPEATAPTVTEKPSVLTGNLRFMGTPAANAAENKRVMQGQLISSLPKGNERLSAEYQQAFGTNPPAGVFDKPTNPGEIRDTANGLVRVGQDNSVTPLGIQGYHQPKDTSGAESNRLDRSYQLNNTQLVNMEKPLADQAERIGRLRATMAQNTPAADALIAPELLTAMAGGAGSGLRMNEAEISRLVGGRSNWESLKAALNKWQLDPSKALSITDAQRTQMRTLVTAIADRGQSRLKMLDAAFQQLIDAGDVKQHRQIVTGVRKTLNDESLGYGTTSDKSANVEQWTRDANGKLVKASQ